MEVRLWRSDNPENRFVRTPIGESGLLVDDNGPVLIVGGEAYPPWSEEAFAGVLLVLTTPTTEEAVLLGAAAAAGYAVEPRVAGPAWRGVDPS